MNQFFFTVAGTVMILHILFLLLPDGKFEKYSRLIAGLIVVCVVATTLFQTDIAGDVLYFDETQPSFEKQEMQKMLDAQACEVAEDAVQKYIEETFQLAAQQVEITMEQEKITGIRIALPPGADTEKIKNGVSDFCDINPAAVVIE